MTVEIRRFKQSDQEQVRGFIRAGMEERWGWIDETANPDLDHIADTYGAGFFAVAHQGDSLVGTGGLLEESSSVARVTRMWVDRSLRRTGIGSQILEYLVNLARDRGFSRVILETTATWEDAVAFYKSHGFIVEMHKDSDVHFYRNI